MDLRPEYALRRSWKDSWVECRNVRSALGAIQLQSLQDSSRDAQDFRKTFLSPVAARYGRKSLQGAFDLLDINMLRGRFRATNQGVVGSNPAGRASTIKELGQRPNSFFLGSSIPGTPAGTPSHMFAVTPQ